MIFNTGSWVEYRLNRGEHHESLPFKNTLRIKILQATDRYCQSGVLIVPHFTFVGFRRSLDLKSRWFLAHTILAETKLFWDLTA